MNVGRRLAPWMLALLIGVLVVGCGDDEDGGGPASGSLTIAAWDTGQGNDPLDTAVREFERANPDADVTVKKTPYPQYAQSLRMQLNTGQSPDVARAVLGYGEAFTARTLADSGLLADLSDSPWVDEIPAAGRYATDDGDTTYAYPVDSTAIGVLHDPATLEREGVAPPETFSDVLALCERFAGSGKVAFAMGASGASGMPLFVAFALAASTAYADDPDFGQRRQQGEVTFAGSGWKQALERYVEMLDAGCFDEDAVGISQEAASQALGQGKALMAVAPTVTLPLFLASSDGAKLEMIAFPGSDDREQIRVPSGPISGLIVPAKADNPELAREFINFYAENRARYAKIDDSIPAIPQGDDAELPSYVSALGPYLSDEKTAPIPDGQWPSPEVRTALATGLVEMMLGKSEPTSILEAMDDAWTPAGG